MISSRGLKHRLALLFGVVAILGLTLSTGGLLEAQSKKEAKPAANTKDASSDDAKDEAKKDDAKSEKKAAVKKEAKFIANYPPVKDKMVTTQGQTHVSRINELIKEKWEANHINPSKAAAAITSSSKAERLSRHHRPDRDRGGNQGLHRPAGGDPAFVADRETAGQS